MYDFFMVVGNTNDFSWWLATHMTFHGGGQLICFFMVVGNAYEFLWWLATHMMMTFHGGWQRV